MNVTVVKTLTEHTNGRRQREDGTWERRVGLKDREPGKPLTREAIWKPCEGPRRVVYGSTEHAESGIRGGDVHFEIAGIEGGSFDLDEAEAEVLFRYYLREFCKFASAANGHTHAGWSDQPAPTVAWKHALRLARRTMVLFGIDLFETNVVDEAPHHAAQGC